MSSIRTKMTTRDALEMCIRAWGCAPRGLTWSLVFLIVSYVISMVGYYSNYWLESSIVESGYEYRNQGLYRFCFKFRGTNCCGSVDDIGSFLHVTRVLILIGYFTHILCAGALYYGIVKKSYIWPTRIGGIFCGLTAFFTILGIIVYGVASQHMEPTNQYSLSWSYALCTVIGVLYIPLTFFILFSK